MRVITNHSSGKQGYALAQAALDSGADGTLITTPTALTPPVGEKVIHVKSVQDILDALLNESSDALIETAAGADFRAMNMTEDKLEKQLSHHHDKKSKH